MKYFIYRDNDMDGLILFKGFFNGVNEADEGFKLSINIPLNNPRISLSVFDACPKCSRPIMKNECVHCEAESHGSDMDDDLEQAYEDRH